MSAKRPGIDDDVVEARILSTYVLPLTVGTEATVTAPFPLTAEEWARLRQLLDVLRPGLARSTSLPVQPCCSAHGRPMCCEHYRRAHFVGVRPCCSADSPT